MAFRQIYHIIFLAAALLTFQAQAQGVTEQNLPDNSPKTDSATTNKTQTNTAATSDNNATPGLTNSLLIDQAKDGLANILTGSGKPISLMFDDQETGNLDRAVDSFKNNQTFVPEGIESDGTEEDRLKAAKDKKLQEDQTQESEKSYIYLASIIYFSKKDWIVWINDKKITSQTNDPKKELYVQSIQRDRAKILWKLSLSKWKIISGRKEELAPNLNSDNQIETSFELKPNQTFVLSSNKVVEGKALVALLKKKEDDKNSMPQQNKAPVSQNKTPAQQSWSSSGTGF